MSYNSRIDPAKLAANAALETLARGLYWEEVLDQKLETIDRPPRWLELTQADRDEYRTVAVNLIAKEYRA